MTQKLKELGIIEVYQGKENKLPVISDILERYSSSEKKEYNFSHVAYIKTSL